MFALLSEETKIQIKLCLFWRLMIQTVGISSFIHVWISTVRITGHVRNSRYFNMALVTLYRSPLFLSGFGYQGWGRAAVLWFLPASVTNKAGKETIEVTLGQAGTFSSRILRTQASFPKASSEATGVLWYMPWGAAWPAMTLRRINSTILHTGRFLHVVFHAVGNVHRSRRHYKSKAIKIIDNLVTYMLVLPHIHQVLRWLIGKLCSCTIPYLALEPLKGLKK